MDKSEANFIELTKKPSLALEDHIEYSTVDNR